MILFFIICFTIIPTLLVGIINCCVIIHSSNAYTNDARYDGNTERILDCICLSHGMLKDLPVAQMKLTAVVPGRLCVCYGMCSCDKLYTLSAKPLCIPIIRRLSVLQHTH